MKISCREGEGLSWKIEVIFDLKMVRKDLDGHQNYCYAHDAD